MRIQIYQCGNTSSTFILEELCFNIFVTAEIAFSVGFIFSFDLDSASFITSTNLGRASAQKPKIKIFK